MLRKEKVVGLLSETLNEMTGCFTDHEANDSALRLAYKILGAQKKLETPESKELLEHIPEKFRHIHKT